MCPFVVRRVVAIARWRRRRAVVRCESNDGDIQVGWVRLTSADIVVIAVFAVSVAIPALRVRQPTARARVFIALGLFVLQVFVYLWRLRRRGDNWNRIDKALLRIDTQIESLRREFTTLVDTRDASTVALRDELAIVRSNALASEAVLQAKLEAALANAAQVDSLRERLLAAQTRAAAFEERSAMVQGGGAPGAAAAAAQPAVRALKDALLNVGKAFPTAGRILFDPPSSQDGQASLSIQPPRRGSMQWPDDVLGGTGQDVGLPDDGGFGTDHFDSKKGVQRDISAAKVETGRESGVGMENVTKASFSALRDAFGKRGGDESEQSEMGTTGGTVANDSNVVSDDDEAAGKEVTKTVDSAQGGKAAENKGETQSEERTTGGLGEVKIEKKLEEARELVKRGRRKDIGVGEAVQCFERAQRILGASMLTDNEVKAEYGNCLVLGAKIDMGGEKTEEKLRKAIEVLRECVERKWKYQQSVFNLGLAFCLLASLQEAPNCESLYEEACLCFDQLATINATSHLAFFNGALAYISRARIASRDAAYTREMYEMAEQRFSRALQLNADDVKSKIYLDECRLKLEEVNLN